MKKQNALGHRKAWDKAQVYAGDSANAGAYIFVFYANKVFAWDVYTGRNCDNIEKTLGQEGADGRLLPDSETIDLLVFMSAEGTLEKRKQEHKNARKIYNRIKGGTTYRRIRTIYNNERREAK